MRIVKHIPNTITSMNLLCGVLGVMSALKGNLDTAFYLMLIGALCDFCDGLSARLLKAYSDLGKELDSLADMVSFGVLPALMMNRLMADIHGDSLLCYIPLLIAVFSALRLAKFNIDTRQSENFIGLATPSCALLVGSLIYSAESFPQLDGILAANTYIIPVISVILSLLLVSEIPMFSFKFKSFRWSENKLKFIFLICAAAFAIIEATLMGSFPLSVWIFTVLVFYVLLNTSIWAYRALLKK